MLKKIYEKFNITFSQDNFNIACKYGKIHILKFMNNSKIEAIIKMPQTMLQKKDI